MSGLSRVGLFLLIARAYGPSQFGSLALAVSVTEIFRTFSEFGIDTVTLRRLSAGEAVPPKILSDVLGTKLLLSSFSYMASMVVLFLLARTKTEILLGAVASLSLLTANVIGVFVSFFQSRLQMNSVLVATVFAYGGLAATSYAAVRYHLSIAYVIALLPAAEAALAFILWRRSAQNIRPNLQLRNCFFWVRESLPLGLMAAMIVLYFRLDNIIIFYMAGEHALGLYAASCRMLEPALMVPHAFSLTLLTVLSRENQVSPERTALIWRSMWPAYLFSIGCAAFILLFGAQALGVVGPQYVAALPVLHILAVVLIVRTMNITLTAALTSEGDYAALAKITGWLLPLNIVLAIVLVSKLGIRGAAYASLLTECCNFVAQGRLVRSSFAIAVPPLRQGPCA
jgi:O-antigen/teichoic acid export membrane protein